MKVKKRSQRNLRVTKDTLDLWEKESEFIDDAFILLPRNAKSADDLFDEYLLDLSDSEDSKKRAEFLRKAQGTQEAGVEEESMPAETGSRINGYVSAELSEKKVGLKKETSEKPSREELIERLHAKMAQVAQLKNSKKATAKREKKAAKKVGREKDSKKQFISKTNPNLKAKTTPMSTPKTKLELISTTSNGEALEKTPLRKSVKKSDGQVVYSKFDFISVKEPLKEKPKPKVSELLKSAEKTEGKIGRLEAIGKTSEAVQVSENQKWLTAIKRASGDKVKDDPNLLKKTLKKQKKLKDTRKKKWTERVSNVEKQKEVRIKKRMTNIQARKDDKKKKQKKLQRKKGRIL